jgi:tRNA (guanine-N7-)-methyltransferase
LLNVRFLRARADQITDLIPPRSLGGIWVTFPDPFPKKRAAKHRLTHPRFLNTYASLLEPGGSLFFKTDAKALFEWSLEQLVAEGWTIHELSNDLYESELAESYKVMTTYERRFVAESLPIHFVRASFDAAD